MNKKVLFALSLVLMMAFSASAQVKRVAILDPIDKEDKVEYFIELMVRSSLTEAISNIEGFEGIERVNVSEVMDEHEFERTGYVNDDQIRRLGQLSGADFILISEVAMSKSNNIMVNARIVDVETGGIGKSAYQLMGSEDYDILHGCESLANRLLGLDDPYGQEKTPIADKKVEPEKPKPEPETMPVETTVATVGKTRLGDLITFQDGTRGIVFYIGADGKGLAVSLSEGEEPWDNSHRSDDISMLTNFEDDEESMSYGLGATYTNTIYSALGNDGRAALWCRILGEGWYLPSMGEMYVLATAFKDNPALQSALSNYRGGEIDGWYWSSSEHNKKEAWNVSDGGWTSTEKKGEKNKVRAIRAFSE